MFSLFLMLSSFAGSASGGTENPNYTYYGLGAGGTSTALGNTFIGSIAGGQNTTGYGNTYVGYQAGTASIFGKNNTFIGTVAGENTNGNGVDGDLTSGNANVFVGVASGHSNTTGAGNTYLGFQSGYLNTTGYGNVFIGLNAGYNETGNQKLYIDFNLYGTSTTPLIYGDFANNIVTVNGKLGVGTQAPVRQLHVVGDQAVFRMDRPYDTTAFMLVRTDGSGNPMKTFVVGANASASNTGEFVINDLGAAVSGAGTRRMTISNSGSVNFPGAVTAASFTPTSSAVFKTNIRTYENALDTVKKLRGVSFDWKDSGKPSVGLIAEEVDKVIPEVVAHNDKDASGVNYDSLVGVLVEAVKEQDKIIQAQQRAIQELQEQQKINAALSQKVSELERLLILSNAVSNAD
jgi:hypothetical protein